MSRNKIIAIILGIVGAILVILGFAYKISFDNSQEKLLQEIEANIGAEEHLVDVSDKALKEYEKASKKDPEQFPPLQGKDFKYYKTKKAKSTGILEIPSINIKAGVIEGVSPRELAVSAGRYITSTTPDKEEGNLVIAAHVSGPVPVFQDLKKVKVGDAINFNYKGTVYSYVVTNTFVAQPHQIEVLENTPGKKTITLFTCTNKGKQRVIVQGESVI